MMLEPSFTAEAVDKMRPMMQGIVDTVLETMVKKGCPNPVDLVEEFAQPVPTQASSPSRYFHSPSQDAI